MMEKTTRATSKHLLDKVATAKFSGIVPSKRVVGARRKVLKLEYEATDEEEKNLNPEEETKSAAKTAPPKVTKSTSASKKTTKKAAAAVAEMTAPKNWLAMWKGIEKMRKSHVAAVDTMGCD